MSTELAPGRARKHAMHADSVTCNISGYKNVVIGKEAGYAINTGCYNTAFGYYVWVEKSRWDVVMYTAAEVITSSGISR
jgi:hypothetical protein